jgi:uncharacterized protein
MAMQLPSVLKAFSVFIDGRGYAGKCDTATLPKVSLKTEEHRGGGMDGSVELDMGMEKLEASATFAELLGEIVSLVGTRKPMTLRGSIEGPDGVKPCIAVIRGLWKEADPGDWKPGEKGALKVMCAPDYYKLTIGGRVEYDIDVAAGVRIIGGVDQLAGRRAALGI